jgi:hypothetical protein
MAWWTIIRLLYLQYIFYLEHVHTEKCTKIYTTGSIFQIPTSRSYVTEYWHDHMDHELDTVLTIRNTCLHHVIMAWWTIIRLLYLRYIFYLEHVHTEKRTKIYTSGSIFKFLRHGILARWTIICDLSIYRFLYTVISGDIFFGSKDMKYWLAANLITSLQHRSLMNIGCCWIDSTISEACRCTLIHSQCR